MSNNELTIIESTMLPFLDKTVVIAQVNNSFEILDFEKKLETINNFQELADNYVYDEKDRQAIRKMNSSIKSLIDDIKKDVKSQQTTLFEVAVNQQNTLNTALIKLHSTLARGLEQDDKLVKAKNKQELMDIFIEAKKSYSNLKNTDFSFEDIFVASWTNRSASRNKTIAEMNKRISSVDSLLGSPMCPTDDIDVIIEALDNHDWDGLSTQNYLIEEDKRRQEEELAKAMLEQAKKERELAEAMKKEEIDKIPLDNVEIALPSKLIKINGADWNRAKSLLTAAKIRYEEA